MVIPTLGFHGDTKIRSEEGRIIVKICAGGWSSPHSLEYSQLPSKISILIVRGTIRGKEMGGGDVERRGNRGGGRSLEWVWRGGGAEGKEMGGEERVWMGMVCWWCSAMGWDASGALCNYFVYFSLMY